MAQNWQIPARTRPKPSIERLTDHLITHEVARGWVRASDKQRFLVEKLGNLTLGLPTHSAALGDMVRSVADRLEDMIEADPYILTCHDEDCSCRRSSFFPDNVRLHCPRLKG